MINMLYVYWGLLIEGLLKVGSMVSCFVCLGGNTVLHVDTSTLLFSRTLRMDRVPIFIYLIYI